MAKKTKRKRLTVLQVATVNKPIRPDLGYGPIETVIYNIDKGLRSLGHRSIVACSADSSVVGEHHVTVRRSLGDYAREGDPEHIRTVRTHLAKALERARMEDVDIVHMHGWLDHIHDGLFSPPRPIVMTLHVPADESGITSDRYRRLNAMRNPSVHFAAISEYQKHQYKGLRNIRTVHHGIELQDVRFDERPGGGDYLFTIGRITSVKGQDRAVEVARRTGSKLIIAGCVQNKPADRVFFEGLKGSIDLFADISGRPVDKDYYRKVIRPLLDSDKQIIYIGELGREQKNLWYRHARATLFPIRWGEPFGLVLVESMACGTPVIAFREGAVPEIVADGRTGFVVDSLDAMVEAVGRIDAISPRECRRHVEDHFSIRSMAERYSELYRWIVEVYEAEAVGHARPAVLKLLPHGPMAS